MAYQMWELVKLKRKNTYKSPKKYILNSQITMQLNLIVSSISFPFKIVQSDTMLSIKSSKKQEEFLTQSALNRKQRKKL